MIDRAIAFVQRFAVAIAIAVAMLAMWDQSYNGRRDVVVSNRAGCERGAQNLAAQVNEIRIEQADNLNTSRTLGVPHSVRISKRATVAHQEQIIRLLDSHIDRGAWRLLDNQRDQRMVHDGQPVAGWSRKPFRCDEAYPPTSPFQFFN